MTRLLEVTGLHCSFGALKVVNDISLSVEPGEAIGIIGPNGAGKTTFFNLIAGTLRADEGDIAFDGDDVGRRSAAARCRMGIGRTFQIPRPFTHMSVLENLLVSAAFGAGAGERAAAKRCGEILEKTELFEAANERASKLTLLQRKRLELAKALATEPRLLLLDEIAGGLTEPEYKQLIATIQSIRGSGVTIIWIEHVVKALLAVVERLVVIQTGAKIADGEPKTVIQDPRVVEAYTGIST